jgi:hypothetical protein
MSVGQSRTIWRIHQSDSFYVLLPAAGGLELSGATQSRSAVVPYNLSLFRNFQVGGTKLELRGEAYNLTNSLTTFLVSLGSRVSATGENV